MSLTRFIRCCPHEEGGGGGGWHARAVWVACERWRVLREGYAGAVRVWRANAGAT